MVMRVGMDGWKGEWDVRSMEDNWVEWTGKCRG